MCKLVTQINLGAAAGGLYSNQNQLDNPNLLYTKTPLDGTTDAKVFGSCIIEHLGFELVIPCFYGHVSMRSEIPKIYLTLQGIAASGEFHHILEAEVPQEYQGRLYAHLGSHRRRYASLSRVLVFVRLRLRLFLLVLALLILLGRLIMILYLMLFLHHFIQGNGSNFHFLLFLFRSHL